jgi:hypothetical protein
MLPHLKHEFKNIKCLDQCFLCIIDYQQNDEITITGCEMELCPEHYKMITKGCIAQSNIMDHAKAITDEWLGEDNENMV